MKPDYFFQLDSYTHAKLFAGCEFPWQALANIEPYLKQFPLGNIEVEVPEGVYLVNQEKISIGKGTKLEPGAYISGPCIIGENCSVRHGAYIRGNFIAGNRCLIGHDTEIKHAIFLDGTHAGHFAYVGDSVIGNDVNLGAGVKCANLKFDNSSIRIEIDGRRLDTGLRKIGSIIGDKTQVGCNAVLNPGTLMGKNVYCYPSLNVGGVIPSDSMVKSKEKPIIITRHS